MQYRMYMGNKLWQLLNTNQLIIITQHFKTTLKKKK